MAKRRRLDPVPFLGGGAGLVPEAGQGAAGSMAEAPDRARGEAAEASRPPAPDSVRDLVPDPGLPRPARARAPIAQVAGGAAAAAALDEVSETLRAAREEGRLVLRLPLGAVEAGHLARDRLAAGPEADDLSRAKGGEAMEELVASLRARGQQAPVEVVELPPAPDGSPRWGLVSGWRRLAALRALHAETGEARFAGILALVRRPASAAEAYVAMVEENEIREALSFWERARIVRRAVEAGAFSDETAALRGLFASASYARRSKIKSFLPVVAALEGVVRFPEAIGERLGLALARALAEDPDLPARAREALGDSPSAEEENLELLDLLGPARRPPAPPIPPSRKAPPSAPTPPAADAATGLGDARRPGSGTDGAPGAPERRVGEVILRARPGRIELSGAGVTPALVDRLEAWLREEAGGAG